MRRQLLQRIDAERALPGGREIAFTFRTRGGAAIPALLLLPAAGAPAPAALLLHGYASRKEEMAGPVGSALLAEGIASLAIDLPLHGTRADPLQAQSARNPLAMMRLWREGIADVRLALRYLAARAEIDAQRLAIVGYSMGAYLAVAVAADEPAVRAVALAAGGDLPQGTPFTSVVRMVADPLRAVSRLAGRPLLMVHGRRDHTVSPAQAQRLFDAAGEPKEMHWYDAGHRLPAEASRQAATWLKARLG